MRHRAAGKPESPAATATMAWLFVVQGCRWGHKRAPKKKEAWQNNKGVSRMVQDELNRRQN
jgi:hypothetical protein